MSDKRIHLAVASPSASLFVGEVDSVQIPMHDGLIGLLPGHAPLIGKLGFGRLRLRSAAQERNFVIEGGFVEIAADTVTVLATEGAACETLDRQQAQEALQQARQEPAEGEEAVERRLERIAAARARIRYASN